MLYGLCMGLSQMSDVHREVVAQAFEYACAAPRSNLTSIGEQGAAVREQAFREAVSGLKDAGHQPLREDVSLLLIIDGDVHRPGIGSARGRGTQCHRSADRKLNSGHSGVRKDDGSEM